MSDWLLKLGIGGALLSMVTAGIGTWHRAGLIEQSIKTSNNKLTKIENEFKVLGKELNAHMRKRAHPGIDEAHARDVATIERDHAKDMESQREFIRLQIDRLSREIKEKD